MLVCMGSVEIFFTFILSVIRMLPPCSAQLLKIECILHDYMYFNVMLSKAFIIGVGYYINIHH